MGRSTQQAPEKQVIEQPFLDQLAIEEMFIQHIDLGSH